MRKLLKYLSGKKGIIVGLIGILTTWLMARGYIDEITATTIGSTVTLLSGVASVQTKQLYK